MEKGYIICYNIYNYDFSYQKAGENLIYLDNSATAPVCKRARLAIAESLENDFGNPSSRHIVGVKAAENLEKSRAVIASALGAKKEEIFFTSGGTEANNLAVFGAVKAAEKYRGKKKIVISAIEHASVMESAKQLESEGYEVVRLKPDRYGNIAVSQIAEAVDENTVLVSLMLVNNEVGSVLPVKAVKGIIKAKNSPALLHCDCVQAFCKLPFTVNQLSADLVSVSAHKIFGPKGVGALYIRKGVRIIPRAFGGEQESKIRTGTQSTALISGFAAAVEAYDTKAFGSKVAKLNKYAREKLEKIDSLVFNSDENASDYIINFSLPGFRSEILLNFFSMKGICVSAASACAKGKPSHVISELSEDAAIRDSAIRLSFSHLNTEEEIDEFTAALEQAKNTLAR